MNKYDEIVNTLKEKLQLTDLDRNATLSSLGLDSLDVVEFILDIEDNYGLKFESSETQTDEAKTDEVETTETAETTEVEIVEPDNKQE